MSCLTETNPVQFHFKKEISFQNKQQAIQKLEALLGVPPVSDSSGSDESVFYLNQASTKSF